MKPPLFRTALLAVLSAIPLGAADTVVLRNGESRSGEIVTETHEGITFKYEVPLSNGRTGFTTKKLPWNAIDSIRFEPLPGEEAALAQPADASEDQLRKLWMSRLEHLARPRSTAPQLGLLYAERLSNGDSRFARERALDIFRRIEAKAWDEESRVRATQGRLQTLIHLDRIEDAMVEARRMAEEAENPAVLLEAKHVLAEAEFDQLAQLEEEHPRWHLDDEVRPRRNAHFHEALDLFLYPYLFHGSREEAAARGLLGAARVHRFAGDLEKARSCAEDILQLYPDTASREPARALLNELSQPSTP